MNKWWHGLKKVTVDWGRFGVIDDPYGDFYDYRYRLTQHEKTLARVVRLHTLNMLRSARGKAGWEAR